MADTKEAKSVIAEGQKFSEKLAKENLENSIEALETVEIDPDAFAALEQVEGTGEAVEKKIEVEPASQTIQPLDKGPVLMPRTDLAPEVPAVKVEAGDVVTDNLASITPSGAPLDSYKRRLQTTLEGIKKPAASAYESADLAAKLRQEHEAGERK